MNTRRGTGLSEFDVAVVGGGLVGATLAALLGKAGMHTALIEPAVRQPYDATRDFDGRVLAITRASESILRHIGAWQHLQLDAYMSFSRMEVWDAEGTGKVSFDCAEVCEPVLGHIVGSGLLQAAIETALASLSAVQWYCPAKLERFSMGADHCVVYLEDGRRISARLLVGADGANSNVRVQAGVGVVERDYGQTAITGVVHTEKAHCKTARQRFLASGPLAFLPLPEAHECSIVWSNSTEQAARLLALDDDAFKDALTDAFGGALGSVTRVGKRSAFPLSRAHARSYVQQRLALVGDAAHRIHPLAGQGANLGLLDVATLAEVLMVAASNHRDIGSLSVLRRYERWRRGENTTMMLAMDAFKDGFGSRLASVRWLRNLGLNLVNRSTPLQRLIMRRAMGLDGDLPSMVLQNTV